MSQLNKFESCASGPAIPFTPATGPRLCTAAGEDETACLDAALQAHFNAPFEFPQELRGDLAYAGTNQALALLHAREEQFGADDL